MKFIKEHMLTIIVLLIFIVLMVVAFKLFGLFGGDSKNGIYGTRLNDIKNVSITSERKREISDNISSLNRSSKVSVDVRGKIINVVVVCNDDVNHGDAKGFADKIVEKLSDDEKKLYDIQIFVKKNTDDASFPIIGYRHRNKDGFSWTNDR
ncbi:MAG: hypothetical protein J6B89_02120 [Bacilli bacterium]|nr:hypothetical protein [Bacilli bacterium]